MHDGRMPLCGALRRSVVVYLQTVRVGGIVSDQTTEEPRVDGFTDSVHQTFGVGGPSVQTNSGNEYRLHG